MATAADFEDFLSCHICFESFEGRDPRYLSCYHAFCLRCLKDIHKTAIQQDYSAEKIICPTCKKITPLENQTVDNLMAYFQAHQVQDILTRAKDTPEYMTCMVCKKAEAAACCLSCAGTLCEPCLQKHNTNRKYKDHAYISCPKQELKYFECPHHPQVVEAYCTDCYTRVCKRCLFMHHADHDCTDFSIERGTFRKLEEDINIKIKESTSKTATVSDITDGIEKRIQDLDREIVQHQTVLHKKIDDQVEALRAKLQTLKDDSLKQLTDITKTSSEAESLLLKQKLTAAALKEPIPHHSEISLQNIQALIDELNLQLPSIQPIAVELGELSFVPEATDMSVGQLKGSLLQKASQLVWKVIEGGGVRSVDYLSNGDVIAVIYVYPQYKAGVYNNTGVETAPPFDVSIVKNPVRVSVHRPSSTVAILDADNKSVTVFTASSNKWLALSFSVTFEPWCMCLMPCGDIIVTDCDSHRQLVKYSTRGQKLQEKTFPHACLYLCVDGNNRIIISDLSQLYVYSQSMQQLFTISGRPSSVLRQLFTIRGPSSVLETPCGICATEQNHILVADKGKQAVLMFSPDGRFIREVITLREEWEDVYISLFQDKKLVVGSYKNDDIQMYQVNLTV